MRKFLPLFTPGTTNEWGELETGGQLSFVRSYTFEDEQGLAQTGFYAADPVTEECVDADTVSYVMTRQGEWEYGVWTATDIATSFYLHDIDGDGIPALLIRWHPI